jgi:hypothetical protein
MAVDQTVRLAQPEADRAHGVAPQLAEGAHAPVAVEEHRAPVRVVHHDHRARLASLGHQRREARFRARVANPQTDVAQHQRAALEGDRARRRRWLRVGLGGEVSGVVHGPVESRPPGPCRSRRVTAAQQPGAISNDHRDLPCQAGA